MKPNSNTNLCFKTRTDSGGRTVNRRV